MKCDDCGGTEVRPDSTGRTCATCNGKMRTEEERKIERIKAAYFDTDITRGKLVQGTAADFPRAADTLKSLYDLPEGVRIVAHTHDEIVYESDDPSKLVEHTEKRIVEELKATGRFAIQKNMDFHFQPTRKTPLSEAIRKWMRGERYFPGLLWPSTDYAFLEKQILLNLPREDWPEWAINYAKENDMSVKPGDIVNTIREILSEAPKSKTTGRPAGLTSYQMANRLFLKYPALYANLESERGTEGRNSLFHTIAQAAMMLVNDGEATYVIMGTNDLIFKVAGRKLEREDATSPIALYWLL